PHCLVHMLDAGEPLDLHRVSAGPSSRARNLPKKSPSDRGKGIGWASSSTAQGLENELQDPELAPRVRAVSHGRAPVESRKLLLYSVGANNQYSTCTRPRLTPTHAGTDPQRPLVRTSRERAAFLEPRRQQVHQYQDQAPATLRYRTMPRRWRANREVRLNSPIQGSAGAGFKYALALNYVK
ncbi:MAG: hypothetical protein QOI57_2801, partial [Rubrobacteraceae bacterium]|nr:hypothetical protein [Rubrobacteraceae bacterium]